MRSCATPTKFVRACCGVKALACNSFSLSFRPLDSTNIARPRLPGGTSGLGLRSVPSRRCQVCHREIGKQPKAAGALRRQKKEIRKGRLASDHRQSGFKTCFAGGPPSVLWYGERHLRDCQGNVRNGVAPWQGGAFPVGAQVPNGKPLQTGKQRVEDTNLQGCRRRRVQTSWRDSLGRCIRRDPRGKA